MAPLRIVFCGTPEFAVPSLRRLAELSDSFSIEAVISQPDRPRGRGQHVSSSPVKDAALELGLHVYQPESIKSESSQEFLKRVAPDAVVIIAYGQIIPARLLTIPRLGWLNLHASLLPKYRGAAPIHWAIANGETITGVTSMQIDAGMDTGPTLLRQEVEIGADETAPELAARMSAMGAGLVADSLLQLERGEISLVPQESKDATYAPVLKKEDGRIEWTRSAQQIYNRMRGFTPWPGAYTTFRGQNCQLWGRPETERHESGGETAALSGPGAIVLSPKEIHVLCGDETRLRLESVQIEGRKKISAREFANGARLAGGERFV
ncbi:MAG TPA: methionyl-tRNA formyltransferase [Candidatus Acidoferrales bacterium]|nr:methionyl-tRNA formyltransferase [Candidatus Acidoferrales bacterium]